MGPVFNTLTEMLLYRAFNTPDGAALKYLYSDGSVWKIISYLELDVSARNIAGHLKQNYKTGSRIVLLYPHHPGFFPSFFGCLYAGMIPVPANPHIKHKHSNRLMAIVSDCHASAILTTKDIQTKLKDHSVGERLRLIDSEKVEHTEDFTPIDISPEDVAFLQYTSGSTGHPKGVVVLHKNICYNAWTINECIGMHGKGSTSIWLPAFHDMGLVAGCLTPMFDGTFAVLMSPLAFIKNPLTWLRTFKQYGARITYIPNFALDLCVSKTNESDLNDLDLSVIDVAFCGSEPVRRGSIKNFMSRFGPCGMKAIHPGYGMAEMVVFISGNGSKEKNAIYDVNRDEFAKGRIVFATEDENTTYVVGCGTLWGDTEIAIVNPQTCRRVSPMTIGELWFRGSSTASGYWENTEETAKTFKATLDGNDDRIWLRTGDLGFIYEREIFITGRIKDLIIIRGENHYASDIEETVNAVSPVFIENGTAAFSIERDDEEKVVVLQEIKKEHYNRLDEYELFQQIRKSISEVHSIEVYGIELVPQRSIAKTTSGKIRRMECKSNFLEGNLDSQFSWRIPEKEGYTDYYFEFTNASKLEVIEWLKSMAAEKANMPLSQLNENAILTDLGIDSVHIVEMTDHVEQALNIILPPNFLWEYPTLDSAAEFLVSLRRDQKSSTSYFLSTFLARIGLFCLIAAAVFFASYQFNKYLFRTHTFKLKEDTQILMTGASRVESALDPKYIPNSENIALPLFPFVGHYYIMKNVVSNSKALKTYILGFSPTHLTSKTDLFFFLEKDNRSLFDSMYPLVELNQLHGYKINRQRYLKSKLKNEIIPNVTYIRNALSKSTNAFPYIGRFKGKRGNFLSEEHMESRIRWHFYMDDKMTGISQQDLNYVDSIAFLATQQDIQLILLRVPVHPSYNDKIPAEFETAYNNKIEKLKNQFPGMRVLDYQRLEMNNSFFKDSDHVNIQGSTYISNQLISDLEDLY